jgi:hypothetical protein
VLSVDTTAMGGNARLPALAGDRTRAAGVARSTVEHHGEKPLKSRHFGRCGLREGFALRPLKARRHDRRV